MATMFRYALLELKCDDEDDDDDGKNLFKLTNIWACESSDALSLETLATIQFDHHEVPNGSWIQPVDDRKCVEVWRATAAEQQASLEQADGVGATPVLANIAFRYRW